MPLRTARWPSGPATPYRRPYRLPTLFMRKPGAREAVVRVMSRHGVSNRASVAGTANLGKRDGDNENQPIEQLPDPVRHTHKLQARRAGGD